MNRFRQFSGAWAIGLMLGLPATPASAADIYVATNGVAPNDGSTWSLAYTNIQDALNIAANGETIYLAGQTFLLTNQLVWDAKTNVSVRGGYAATNDANAPGTPDSQRWPTILTRAAAYTNRIMFVTNVSAGTLERITFTGGYQTNVAAYGGGLHIAGSMGLVISICVISSNIMTGASSGGGGLAAMSGSAVTLRNCLVKGNSATTYGNGICLPSGGDATVTLLDSIVADNRGACSAGGGICNYGTVALTNCLVAGNSTLGGEGDGIRNGGTVNLGNCTVAYNTGQGIYGASTVSNSIVWGNGDDIVGTATVSWSDIEDGDYNGINGCISANPLFQGGYYLATNSACVDWGASSASARGLTNYTTRADGSNDSGWVDLGYHYQTNFDLSYEDVYVATNGDNGHTGTNAADPFLTITKALSMARDGTRVHVGAGSYTNGLETFPLTVANLTGAQILGTNRATTALNAAGSSNRVLTLTNCPGVTVSDLTLTGGNSTNDGFGAGLALWSCGGAMLSRCAISNNTLTPVTEVAYGGGLYANFSIVSLNNCLVKGNSVLSTNKPQFGAGIYIIGGALTLCDSIIANNRCLGDGSRYGGGVYVASGGPLALRNCLVAENSTTSTNGVASEGGGIMLYSAATLENCTVANNTGQGIRVAGALTITNSIFWGNGDGDDLALAAGGSVSLGYSDIKDADTGINVIHADPLFVNTNAADYHLTRNSPCVNTGTNQAWMATARSLDGTRRLVDGRVDLGPYECASPRGDMLVVH